MGTYASAEELAAYVADDDLIELPTYTGPGEPPPDDAVERLIADAERDVDRLLALGDRDPVTGLRLTPAALSAPQRAALSRATCAAAAWRLHAEPEDVAGAADGIASVGGIRLLPAGRPPGPRPVEELAGFGLPLRSGTVAPAVEEETT